MPLELETIPPDSLKLVKANFGVDIFGDRTKEIIETLWRTADNKYLIDYGLEIIEQSHEDVVQWLEEVMDLDWYHYKCYNDTDLRVLQTELMGKK